ncbi:MAG: TetR/AcrR family transcriptional regulator [Planctomycetota bacterium]
MLETDTELKSKLLASALELFTEHGRENVSVRDIAEHAGVSHGSIRYHYGTKDQLYVAALMRLESSDFLGTEQRDCKPSSDMSPEAAVALLKRMVRSFVNFQAKCGPDRVKTLGLLRAEVSRDGGPDPVFYERVIAPGHEAIKTIINAIRPDIEDNDLLEILAFNLIFQCVMIRIGHGIVVKRLQRDSLTGDDIERIADVIVNSALDGLRNVSL